MNTYFNIRYEFDKSQVHRSISARLLQPGSDYLCVADGVILNIANRNTEYLDVLNNGMFSICDSSYVPLYLRWIYGKRYEQYCGSQIFIDIVRSRKYRMAFVGASQPILDELRRNLIKENPDVGTMLFRELPFRDIDDFDYEDIAKMIEADNADIVWVSLGAPKQEFFMNRLKPFLSRGVMIAVGAAFKFYSGVDEKRAPAWMINNHLEFVYRVLKDPKKQIHRCKWIIATLPELLYKEWKRKRKGEDGNASSHHKYSSSY